MFHPKYTISNKLLFNTKQIAVLTAELNNRFFSKTVLMKFEKKANSLSSYASTSIEGNPIPLTDVKQLLKSQPKHIRNTEREVINYNHALETLSKEMAHGSIPISVNFICQIQKLVTTQLIEKYRCGKIRNEPVFVNNPKTRKPVYLPPDHADVPRLMHDLVEFIKTNRGTIEPLIVAGIFHKQFVIIHPFVDGNGRTARLVTKTLLADMGLNTFNLFSFENYYNKNVTSYFQNVGILGNYYDVVPYLDFTQWLEYFTDGILDELSRVKKELENEIATPQTTLHDYHNKLIQFIKENGFITDKDYAKLTERAKATRALDFKTLLTLGLIERFSQGRSTYYKMK